MATNLPWQENTVPLMLAPMQGLTNRALRAFFIEQVAPDVVFTEFVRVRPGAKKGISAVDRREAAGESTGTPLVVQLIGRQEAALVAAARAVQEVGARHLNLNLGCPFGRMSANSAGGALLRDHDRLRPLLAALRRETQGSLSVKVRAGFADPEEIFSHLDIFEQCGVDFIVLHPRTVQQRYGGEADHGITARVVAATGLPVIANGDIFTAARGRQVLAATKAAGLMLGRGAIADPWLFARLRGELADDQELEVRAGQLQLYINALVARYQQLFAGEQQVLCKLKAVLSQMWDPRWERVVRRMKRSRSIVALQRELDRFVAGGGGQ